MQQTIVQLPTPTKAIAVYSPILARMGKPPLTNRVLRNTDEMTSDIGKPKRLILRALAEYYYLTAEQITRLLFSPASYSYVNNTHMKFLLEKELVERVLPAKQTLYGRSPFVYTLSREGFLLAKRLGFPMPTRYRQVTERTHKPYTLSHILAVNEFLIKTVLLAKHHEDIVLRRTVHDKVLATNPLKAQIPETGGEYKTKNLIPDSWVDMGQKRGRRRYCYCVEQNLTKVTQGAWRETVRKYLYCLPSYKAQFGTDILTVLVSIQTGTDFPVKSLESLTTEELAERKQEERARGQRRTNLLQWTEAEVTAQNRQADGDMFRFSAAPLDQITFEELYFAPHWYAPFQEAPRSLLRQALLEDAGA